MCSDIFLFLVSVFEPVAENWVFIWNFILLQFSDCSAVDLSVWNFIYNLKCQDEWYCLVTIYFIEVSMFSQPLSED